MINMYPTLFLLQTSVSVSPGAEWDTVQQIRCFPRPGDVPTGGGGGRGSPRVPLPPSPAQANPPHPHAPASQHPTFLPGPPPTAGHSR